MVIWINGAFGSGKTNSAYELSKRLDSAFVFDPEEMGFYIRSNIPQCMQQDDFQNHIIWRTFNREMIEYISKNHDGIIIVPMTITNVDYHNELVGGLREKGIPVNHFTLIASKEVLLKRLKKRGDGSKSWPALQIDRCLESLSLEQFSEHILTDNMTIDDVVEMIGQKCNLKLKVDQRNWLQKRRDRLEIWTSHMRFFK